MTETRTHDVAEGVACTDCLMVIANADTSGIDDLAEWEARVEAHDATEGGSYDVVLAGDEDTESYFSSAACDYCGTRLAGDRYPIPFIAR